MRATGLIPRLRLAAQKHSWLTLPPLDGIINLDSPCLGASERGSNLDSCQAHADATPTPTGAPPDPSLSTGEKSDGRRGTRRRGGRGVSCAANRKVDGGRPVEARGAGPPAAAAAGSPCARGRSASASAPSVSGGGRTEKREATEKKKCEPVSLTSGSAAK